MKSVSIRRQKRSIHISASEGERIALSNEIIYGESVVSEKRREEKEKLLCVRNKWKFTVILDKFVCRF